MLLHLNSVPLTEGTVSNRAAAELLDRSDAGQVRQRAGARQPDGATPPHGSTTAIEGAATAGPHPPDSAGAGPVVPYFLVDRRSGRTDVILHSSTTMLSVGLHMYGSTAAAEALAAHNGRSVLDALVAGTRLHVAPLPGYEPTPAAVRAFQDSPWFAWDTADPAAEMAKMGVTHPSEFPARKRMLDAAFEVDVATVIRKLDEKHYSDADEKEVLTILGRWGDERLTKQPDRSPNGQYLDKFFSRMKQKIRKIGVISEEVTSYYSLLFNHFDAKAELRALRDRSGHRGDEGTPEMSAASFLWDDISSGAMRDRIFAYGEGVAKGTWSGVKGTVDFAYTAVTEPGKAWKQIKAMPGAMAALWENRDALWRRFVNASPKEQAELIGRLVGEVEAGLAAGAATKVAAGAASGWLARLADKGGKLGAAAQLLLRSGAMTAGIVGRIGASIAAVRRFFSAALERAVRPLLAKARDMASSLTKTRPPTPLRGHTAEGFGDDFTHSPLPETREGIPVDQGRTGLTEGELLTSYAQARRSRARKNPATASARGTYGPHIRDNLYSGARQRRAVRNLETQGILEVSADKGLVKVRDADRYLDWLERAYRHHGLAHLHPKLRQAVGSYIGGGRELKGIGVGPTGRSFAGSLPGTHAELLAINDALMSGSTKAIDVAVVRARSGQHFVACLHCGRIIDELADILPEARLWTGRATSGESVP